MNNSGKAAIRRTIWCWRRWINSTQQELWIERLQAVGCFSWVLTQKPAQRRILLSVHAEKGPEVASLVRQFGGRMVPVKASEWLQSKPAPPLQVNRRFQIVHEKIQLRKDPALFQLHIPQGMAFGSGEHATTLMLLRALAQRREWKSTSVLDLGTGSGVLALAARHFGARKIVATDFDRDAIRIAQENEMLNFPTSLVDWKCADVKLLRSTVLYDLVLANLFSGILVEAAPRIKGTLLPGGQLWLSGILRSQHDEIVAAYRRQKLRLIGTIYRGKWTMIQWQKPA